MEQHSPSPPSAVGGSWTTCFLAPPLLLRVAPLLVFDAWVVLLLAGATGASAGGMAGPTRWSEAVEADLFRFLDPLIPNGMKQSPNKEIDVLTRPRRVVSSSCGCSARTPPEAQRRRWHFR